MYDALHCPDCDEKMRVMQGAAIVHEGVLVYWRRKKCGGCGHIMKTLEVPASVLDRFTAVPEDKDMS